MVVCGLDGLLFLTSKVRLHCDGFRAGVYVAGRRAFPDLQGQAPLRPDAAGAGGAEVTAFS